jgi:hypothetical protein
MEKLQTFCNCSPRYRLDADRKIIENKTQLCRGSFSCSANYKKKLPPHKVWLSESFWKEHTGGLISSLAVTNPGWMTAINYPSSSSSLRRMQIASAWCINFCGRRLLGGTDKSEMKDERGRKSTHCRLSLLLSYLQFQLQHATSRRDPPKMWPFSWLRAWEASERYIQVEAAECVSVYLISRGNFRDSWHAL